MSICVGKCDIACCFFRDAWNKLGNMDREVAMLNYVEELKKVILESQPTYAE